SITRSSYPAFIGSRHGWIIGRGSSPTRSTCAATVDTVLPRHGWRLASLLAFAALALPATASADDPTLGLGAPQLTDNSCAPGSPEGCQRLRFAYGPVTVTPGA